MLPRRRAAHFRHSARKGAVLLPWALATCSGFPAATLLNFRHLLEKHNLSAAIFAKVGELLLANGLKLCGGNIVDATIIAAPSSSKSQEKARDPEMHQTFKAGQWYFGMKTTLSGLVLKNAIHGFPMVGFDLVTESLWS